MASEDWNKPEYKGTLASVCSGIEECIWIPYRHLVTIRHKPNQMPCVSTEGIIPRHIPYEQRARYLKRIFRKRM